MYAPRVSRRTVLAGTAVATALTAVPALNGPAHAAEETPEAETPDAVPGYRWRNAVIGGTGFVTGIVSNGRGVQYGEPVRCHA